MAIIEVVIHRLGPGNESELDEDLWQLRRSGERVSVQPKVLALLFYLARSALAEKLSRSGAAT